MECGHKRSPFAAGGDIAAAEIAHDVKARKFCNECRVVELQCPALFGTMPNCLTVNADGGNVLSADVGYVEQLIDAIYVELTQFDGSDAHAINFIVAGLTQRKELFLERLRKFDVVMADQTRSHSGKIDGDGIYAVKTGSRH